MRRRLERLALEIRFPQLPNRKLLHEIILEKIKEKELTKEEIVKSFPDYSYIIEEILNREIEAGRIEKYEEKSKEYYRITNRGKNILDLEPKRKFMYLSR